MIHHNSHKLIRLPDLLNQHLYLKWAVAYYLAPLLYKYGFDFKQYISEHAALIRIVTT